MLVSFVGFQEEKLRGRPGYEHLNEPLHILIEADMAPNMVDIKLHQAKEILEELLKPVVSSSNTFKTRFLIFISWNYTNSLRACCLYVVDRMIICRMNRKTSTKGSSLESWPC